MLFYVIMLFMPYYSLVVKFSLMISEFHSFAQYAQIDAVANCIQLPHV